MSLVVLVGDGTRQAVLDALQARLGETGAWRITRVPVETTIPFPEADNGAGGGDGDCTHDEPDENGSGRGGQSREVICNRVWEQAQGGRNYVLFVLLSTVVAAFGMLADNVAVVIGAMVIAPLPGPNLALAVAAALGDPALMRRALLTSLQGLALALGQSLAIGALWPGEHQTPALTERAQAGFDGIAVALASGAAAALSLVTGLSTALVGVMVAVALLPPTVAVGIFLGAGLLPDAGGAALLLTVNIVCVNLAAQIIMLSRGITPRNWWEKPCARRASLINAAIWAGLPGALALLLWARSPLPV